MAVSKLISRSLVLLTSLALLSAATQALGAEKNGAKAIYGARVPSLHALAQTRKARQPGACTFAVASKLGAGRTTVRQPQFPSDETFAEWLCFYCECGKIDHIFLCFSGAVFNNCFLHPLQACLWVQSGSLE